MPGRFIVKAEIGKMLRKIIFKVADEGRGEGEEQLSHSNNKMGERDSIYTVFFVNEERK